MSADRYLLFKSSREELVEDIEALKKKIRCAWDGNSWLGGKRLVTDVRLLVLAKGVVACLGCWAGRAAALLHGHRMRSCSIAADPAQGQRWAHGSWHECSTCCQACKRQQRQQC